ncbi:TlyA family RNA methyltransferase [Caloranaerobacter azorensis]|uniref:TlyA family RNA methyltransferase n=1 Tax=Caloranaerobacter azorensis TaxID=116090 RepID=A0A6P1YAX9_9FIRM|nr:TlyA family RNA methyltransferase [Caloranaerobacter azorensis]QIB26018.1 TlyA family RNA methyltransferase [Caloranaerobacter azorensis]
MKANKERIDILLVKKGLVETREKAKKYIMAGIVYVEEQKIDKPGTKVDVDSNIVVKGNPLPYVSRGGLKLEKALNTFPIDINGKIAMDIGASTGGFTDCMLQNGAKKVYAVDVGYGQLAWKLRNDDRVVVMERTNIRYVKPEDIGELVDFVTIDVSFISLKLVLPVVYKLVKEDADIIALIKPQFEAGRDKVGKKGVVREKKTHIEVITSIFDFCKEIGFHMIGLTYSPVKGAEGNIEYLAHIVKSKKGIAIDRDLFIKKIVDMSHMNL